MFRSFFYAQFACRFLVGLIPTHAGKTSSFSWLLRRSAAHPRSHRENTTIKSGSGCITGSSPLTRGKHRRVETARAPRGLIPAHAGKTATSRSFGLGIWAHPRSRGENNTSATPNQLPCGSSPLTRRKRDVINGRADRVRLIPAHAEKTTHPPHPTSCLAAHPRSRGENQPNATFEHRGLGSSPLTRGKHHHRHQPPVSPRLIPAHAGKTESVSFHGGQPRAHPRSRGENVVAASSWGGRQGSSPLTRGKQTLSLRTCN